MDAAADQKVESGTLNVAPDVAPQVKVSIIARVRKFFSARTALPRETVATPTATPWNAVALLNFFQGGAFRGHGTGFFVRPDMVVTAAHSFRMTGATAVGVYPSFDAELNPSTNANGLSWAWDGSRDVAVIITQRPALGVMGVEDPATQQARLAGYAFPYGNNTPRLSFADGACRMQGTRVEYDILVNPGDSGAPVFVPAGDGSTAVLGIHVNTTRPPNQSNVIGVAERGDDELERILLTLERTARSHIRNAP